MASSSISLFLLLPLIFLKKSTRVIPLKYETDHSIIAQALQCFFIALGIKAVAQRKTCEAARSCSHTSRLPVEGSVLAVSSAWQPTPHPRHGHGSSPCHGSPPKATSSVRTSLASFSNSLALTGYLPFLLNSCSLVLITYLRYCVFYKCLLPASFPHH